MQRRGYYSPAIKQDEKTTHIIMTPCDRHFRIDIMVRTLDGSNKYEQVIKNVHVDEAIELANKEFQDEVQRQKANGPVTTEDTPPEHNGFAWSPLTSLKASDFDLPDPQTPHDNPDIHGAEGGTGVHRTGALSTSYSRAGKSEITIAPLGNDDGSTRSFSNIAALIGYIREQGTYNGYDLVHQNFDRQSFSDLKIPYSHLSEGIFTHGSFTNNSFAFGTHDGAHFSDSDFTDSSFHAASLKDTDFIGSTLHNVDFRNADL